MASLQDLEGQLKNTEGLLSQYSGDLPSELESQIQKAHTPVLKESLDVTKNLMGDYLGRYFDTTQMGVGMQGTTAKDLSPTQKLGVMGRELGTMSGELQAAQQYSDYLGAQMNDMYSKALQAAQFGQQALADQYSRQMQMYQMAWQEAENEKDRRLQESLAPQPTELFPQPTETTDGGGVEVEIPDSPRPRNKPATGSQADTPYQRTIDNTSALIKTGYSPAAAGITAALGHPIDAFKGAFSWPALQQTGSYLKNLFNK